MRILLASMVLAVLSACSGDPATSTSTHGTTGASTGSTSASVSSTTGSTSASTGSTSASSGSTSGSHSSSSASSSTGTSASSTSASSSSSGSSGSTTSGCDCNLLGCENQGQLCDQTACACIDPPTSSTAGSTGGSSGSTGSGLCATQRCVVYAETAHSLYQVDPTNPASTTKICDFGGALAGTTSAKAVNDIAVDLTGQLFAITKTDLYSINGSTCSATHLAALGASGTTNGFNGLSFDAQGHLLAANDIGDVKLIDVATGSVQTAGSFGGHFTCSGDIVTLSTGVVYATAKDTSCTGSSCNDKLVSLNPGFGYQATLIGDIGYAGVFGLGYWDGTLYGFTRNGQSIQIDPVTGAGTLLGTQSTLTFFGAGTTPLAPVVNH